MKGKQTLSKRCEILHNNACRSSQYYVDLFCDIMGYNEDGYKAESHFIGDDPFGVVFINDDFWNMSDIFYVISEYDKWFKFYGEDLPSVIKDWYDYSLDASARNTELHEQDEWFSVKDKMPKPRNLKVRPCKIGEIVMVYDVLRNYDIVMYNEDDETWRSVRDFEVYYSTEDILYWKSVKNPDIKEEFVSNLHSWLLGWRPDGMHLHEYEEEQKKRADESIARLKGILEEFNAEADKIAENDNF